MKRRTLKKKKADSCRPTSDTVIKHAFAGMVFSIISVAIFQPHIQGPLRHDDLHEKFALNGALALTLCLVLSSFFLRNRSSVALHISGVRPQRRSFLRPTYPTPQPALTETLFSSNFIIILFISMNITFLRRNYS
jgi:hypothetical protein